MAQLGKLTEVRDLRTVWPKEAKDFTPWLAQDDNIAILSDALGIDIEVVETESSVGSFNVDIFANEIGTDRKIIIENQLEDTDHDHLGKLITYASGKSANVVVWIVKRAREEHKAAIEWLNSRTDDKIGFFLCEIKLYRIGNSEPALKFEVIEKPNDWIREIKKNESVSENEQRRFDYWTAFNNYAYKDPQFSKVFKPRKPSTDHWMDFSIGSSACHLAVEQIIKRNEVVVELYINEDKELFHSLYSNKNAIEEAIGFPLDWRELPERKASRVIISKSADLENRDQWESQFDWIMETLLKMKKGFRNFV